MSDEQNGHGTGNGHGAKAAVTKRLEQLDPHPYLLERGFAPAHIQQAGWRVEALGDLHAHYGLPDEAAECEMWFIPYRHPNGQVWFKRALFIREEDRARFGGRDPDHRGPSALYDPFLILGGETFEPRDSVLLVEGEASTVAAEVLSGGFPVVGLTPGHPLTPALASYLGHIPCVYVWLDREPIRAIQDVQYIAERLREAGVQEVRSLPSGMSAAEALRSFDFDRAVEAVDGLLRQAEVVQEQIEDDWPLMPRPVPPRFPIDALPDTMGAFVEAVAVRTRTPPDMAAIGALGVLATVAMTARVDCGGWEEEALSLYTLAISPSGDHKSTVLKTVAAPLYHIDAEARELDESTRANADTERQMLEARKKALISKASKLEEEDEWANTQAELEEVTGKLATAAAYTEPRMLTDDSTPEGLARLMSKHPHGIAVASAEAAIVNNLLGHYSDQGKANLFVVCKAFNGEGPIFVDRGTAEPLFIPRALLSLTLFAQPGVLKKVLANETARDQGLIGRFVYADLESASTVGYHDHADSRPRVAAHLQEAWRQTVQRVKAASVGTQTPQPQNEGSSGGFGGFGGTSQSGGLELSLSPSSHKLLVELMNELEPRKREGGDLRPFNDWLARHHGRIARIAALLHLTEHDPEKPIGEHTMRCALRIGDYLLDHMLIALTAPDPRVRRAMAYLAEKGIDRVSLRDVHRMPPLNKRVPVAEAADLIQALVRIGVLRPLAGEPEAGPTPGRPRGPVYAVNPNLRKVKPS